MPTKQKLNVLDPAKFAVRTSHYPLRAAKRDILILYSDAYRVVQTRAVRYTSAISHAIRRVIVEEYLSASIYHIDADVRVFRITQDSNTGNFICSIQNPREHTRLLKEYK